MTKFTYIYQDVEVLSDVPIEKSDRHLVRFTDGSVADLDEMAIMNIGTGNIRFRIKDKVLPGEVEAKKISLDSLYELYLKSHNTRLDFEIIATGGEPEIELIGTKEFITSVQVKEYEGSVYINKVGISDGGPVVSYGRVFINGKRDPQWEEIDGKVIIRVKDMIPSLKVSSNYEGTGIVESPVGKVHIDVTGSQQFDLKSVDNLDVLITGSSTINVDQLRNQASIKITGSGNVNIFSGEAKQLDLILTGSGNISANLAAETATLALTGSGNIILAHAIDGTKEKHGGSGTITVLKRGI